MLQDKTFSPCQSIDSSPTPPQLVCAAPVHTLGRQSLGAKGRYLARTAQVLNPCAIGIARPGKEFSQPFPLAGNLGDNQQVYLCDAAQGVSANSR
jgi:hypothetical protein